MGTTIQPLVFEEVEHRTVLAAIIRAERWLRANEARLARELVAA